MRNSVARLLILCSFAIPKIVFGAQPTNELARFFLGTFTSENSKQMWAPDSSPDCYGGCTPPKGISATVTYLNNTDRMLISIIQNGKAVYSCIAEKEGSDPTEYVSFLNGEGFCEVEIESKNKEYGVEIGIEIEVPWHGLEMFRKLTAQELSDFQSLYQW